jgi:hypothetical protein
VGIEYRADCYDTSGALVAQIGGTGATGFLELSASKQVNTPGLMQFMIAYKHPAVALLSDKYLIHLYRRWPEQGIDWYVFFYGIYRDDVWENRDGRDVVTFICPGQLAMLSWRLNAYAAETSNKTTWTSKPAETIMKNIVTNNMTSSGTTGAGRDRNATSAGTINGFTFTVEADSARGASLDYKSARAEVLKDCQDIANAAVTGDFDLVKTGATTWQFRYYPLLGTDRSTTVIFSTDFGNMRNPKLARARSSEKTAMIVGGGGNKSSRTMVTRTGGNYAAGTNDIEGFVNGANTTGGTTNTATLNAIGDKEATKRRLRAQLSYDVAQVSASLLDKHYFSAIRSARGPLA